MKEADLDPDLLAQSDQVEAEAAHSVDSLATAIRERTEPKTFIEDVISLHSSYADDAEGVRNLCEMLALLLRRSARTARKES